MARMEPAELPTALFQPGRARLFHTSGITLGLSESACGTAQQALQLAREAGIPSSLDINYRQRLWSPQRARQCLEPLLGQLELLLVAERDIQALWPEAWDANCHEQTLRRFQRWAPNSLLIMTRGSAGAALLTPSGELYQADAFQAQEVERLGGGDAFAAGFLSAWLAGKSHSEALRQGAAVAAFKYATPGDIAWINRSQLDRLLADPVATGLCR
jgi:2-dehydro-3-deoxygluconokinase